MTPLSEALSANLFQRLGSGQHVEIAGYIRDAAKTVFSADAAAAVRKLWADTPWTVESNLDLVTWPGAPTWYEIPGNLAGVPSGDKPVLGFLMLPHPEEEGLYMVVTAFQTSAIAARHCYAVALLDVASLTDNAIRARHFYSKTPSESVERIMMQIGVSISDDFRDELMITEDGREEVVEAAMRDATAEIPLLLSILAVEGTENGLLIDFNETSSTVTALPLRERSRLGRFSDRMKRRLSSGLVRIPRRNRSPRLAWFA
ncbi:hypothetical protein HFO56_01130 [Rhizobium laguerreae]|uniref:hypothetical protein n=1 Tax=Rhizobium laguerreae TaxID=1076926 RepID=UPI001C9015ED|nr:hypothetical protein [Rhizobium laguerreae]MBY3151030.1 hypothetical protein [Rhizobium laguerreae]